MANSVILHKAVVERLRDTILDLMICPAFSPEVFEKNPEAHAAWKRANETLTETAYLVKND